MHDIRWFGISMVQGARRLVSMAVVTVAASVVASPAAGDLGGPQRLAIYYGYPSLVNGAAGNLAAAVASFSGFDVVVLGDGLEHPAHPDHANTAQIIGQLSGLGVQVYGYIDMGVLTQNLSLATAQQYVDEWAAMGVAGIFWDDAGFDYGVTRARQVALIDYTHNQGLKAFVNAWVPDDVFATVDLVPTPLAIGDWYLAESHPVADGQLVDLDAWWSKSTALASYRDQTGVKIAAIATGADGPLGWANAPTYRQSLWAAYLFAWDAFGFTNVAYSSSGVASNRLRALPRVATQIGTTHTGVPTMTGAGSFERTTDIGTIKVWGAVGSGGGTFVGGVCDTNALGTAIWPDCSATPPPQSSPFGPRQKASEGFRYDWHRGVDIPQPLGAPVYATMDGIVRLAGVSSGYSDQVIQIRHRGNTPYLFSNVLHMDSVVVQVDDLVTVGDLVGYSGESVGGFDHMHFELRDTCATQNCNRNPWGYLPYTDVAPVVPTLGGANLSSIGSAVVLDLSTPDDQLDLDGATLTWGSSYNLGIDATTAASDPDDPLRLDHPVLDLGGGARACIFPAAFNLASTEAAYRIAFSGLPAAVSGAASGRDLNASSVAAPLVANLPALAIAPAAAQAVGVPGQTVSLKYQLKNGGGQPLQLTIAARSAQNNSLVLSHDALALAPGVAQNVTVSVTLSPLLAAGIGDCVLLEVDAGGPQQVIAVGQVSASACSAQPGPNCVGAGSSALSIKYDMGGRKNALAWKFGKPLPMVAESDFGPALEGGSTYDICVYDALGEVPQLSLGMQVPSAGTCGAKPCWKQVRGGFKYKDRTATQGGITAMQLKSGAAGKAKLSFQGKGVNLNLPSPTGQTYLHAESNVVVQVHARSSGKCWESNFAAPLNFQRHTATQLKAKFRP